MARQVNLGPVIALLEQQQQQLSLQLKQINLQIQAHQQQINKIQKYRLDYIAQLNDSKSKHLEANYIQQFYRFIKQLDAASEKEYGALKQTQDSIAQVNQQYQQINSKLKGLQLLVNKQNLKKQRLQQKQEQHILDEVALNNFIRGR